jgi:glycosyltransferase involved in cell wall biosynthesis
MRILFLTHYALPHIGGIETAVAALRGELARRGHEVPHIASDALGHGEPATTNGVVRVRAFSAPLEARGVPWPVFGPELLAVLRREIARADVVHGHGYLYQPVVAGLLAARLRRRRPRTVLTEHVGRVPQRTALLGLVQDAAIAVAGRTSAHAADAVVVLNDRLAAELRALRPQAAIHTIPNGIDTETFRPPATAGERALIRRRLGWDERPRVLLVGRLTERKGIDLTLAATRAARGAFQLVVAGPGRLRAAAPEVEVLGPVPRALLADLYRAADALVLPSAGEGFPIAAQEAAASGLPVVLARDPGYREHVAAAPGAFRLVERTPAALAAALAGLGPVPADATAAARRAFGVASAADAHERLYDALCG